MYLESLLKANAGFRMVHIPFTGAGPAVVALLGGQVDAIASGPASVAQHIRSGRLFVPAGTPDDVLHKLRAAARKVATDPQVQQVIRTAGSPVEYLDAPEFQSYWDSDAAVMAEVVQRIGKVE